MQEPQPQSNPTSPAGEASADFNAEQMNFGPGIAYRISSDKDILMTQAGALVVAAGANMDLSFGGGLLIASGRDQLVTNGGALAIVVGRDLTLTDGGTLLLKAGGAANISNSAALVAVTPHVTAHDSLVGVVLSPHVELTEGTRVLLGTRQALALGAAFGAVFGLLSWLIRRR